MKNFPSSKGLLLFSVLFIFLINLPISYGKSSLWNKPLTVINDNSSPSSLLMIYNHLNLNCMGLSETAFDYAIAGFEKLIQEGKIANDDIISIIDFSKSSAEKRLFVIDLKNERLIFNTYVAHGQKSGSEFAKTFSNKPESYQSSLGFYETTDTYIGKNGYSLHLNGLEKGINDNANQRAIVMHGAPYVSEQLIHAKGYIGRSWGCPAIPEILSRPIINKIKNGSCLFIYANDQSYFKKSLLQLS